MFSNVRIIIAVVSVVALTGFGYWIRDLSVEGEITRAENVLKLEYKAELKRMKDQSHAYQKEITDNHNELSRIKRLYTNVRVRPVISQPSSDSTGGADTGRTQDGVGLHGISASTLLDTAARCDRYRIRVNYCKEYLENIK